MSDDTTEAVLFNIDGRTALITINRPEVRNCVNGAVARGIEDALDALEANDEVWTGIVTGAGGAFSTGADLKAINAGRGSDIFTKRGGFAGITTRQRHKPLIAAVDGLAWAGGLEIVLACDLVIASYRSSFALPEVKRSLVAGAGGLFRTSKATPRGWAMYMILTGQPISASTANFCGLVQFLCEPRELLIEAKRLAEQINENAPLAVRFSRNVLIESEGQSEEVGWDLSRAALRAVATTEDYGEGIRAFAERRPPQWKGR